MSATDDRTLTGARWSTITRTGCARTGVYGYQHAPTDEIPARRREELERYYERGKMIEDWAVAKDIVTGALSSIAERQVEIPWPIRADLDAPIGTGHADAYDPPERLIVEYVSTEAAALPEGKVLQAAGYALNHPDATEAVVVSIDPHTLLRRQYPIDLDGVAPKVRELEDAIVAGIAGEMPERVCSQPSDGYHKGCPFVGVCFDGWEPSPLEQLVGLDAKLERLADLTDQAKDAKTAAAQIEAERDALRDELRPLLDAGETYRAPGSRILVKRSAWIQSGGFSLADATKAGHTLPADLAAFVSPPSERERWTVKRYGSDGKPE